MTEQDKKGVTRKDGRALATIGAVNGPKLPVHFNPVSLQLAINNQLKKNAKGIQYIGTTTMKLTMDLIFDGTDTGQDVTENTRRIQALLGPEKPPGERATNGPPPPKVEFEWGTIKFDGIIEGYKETIDFFSIDGVPLRSSVNLTLSRDDRIFEKAKGDHVPGDAAVDGDLRDLPPQSAADAGNNANAPGAARGIAGANNQESLRFGTGASLTVGASVQLKPAVAFSSGAAGLSLGGGAGLSLGGGAGMSLGGGAGLSVGGGGGIALGGSAGVSLGGSAGVSGSASAGISGLARLSATEGAFSGLRISTSPSGATGFDPSRLAPKISSATAAVDAGATFQVGGKATMQGSGGLRADVGASGKLSFDAR